MKYKFQRNSKRWKEGLSMKNKISLLLSFMTLIIRIPRYTYWKSQNHYISTVIKIRWIFSNLHFLHIVNVENIQTFYIHVILHVMVYPFYYFLKFPLKQLIVLLTKKSVYISFLYYSLPIQLSFLGFRRKIKKHI